MALNFGILQPVNIGSQFMAGQQQAQQNELAQQQSAMRQQEMEMRKQEMGMRQQEAATQAEDRATKLANAAKRNEFLTNLSSQMEQGGHKLNRQTLSSMLNFGLKSNETSLVNLATEGLKALDEQESFQTEMGRLAPKSSTAPVATVAPAAPGALGSGTFGITPAPANALAPAPVAAAAPVNALTAAPTTAAPTNALVGGYTRSQIEQMMVSPNARIRDMGKNLLAALPKETAPTELVRNYEFAKAQGFTGSLFDYERKLKEAGRAPATPATPSAPVAVVDPVTGKQVLVSREEALRGRMTPAAAMESLPPKEIQKREAALPQATTAVTGFEKKTDSFVKDLTALRDHPGLSQITGIAAGRMPGITAEGRAAQALYDKVIAKGGFQALQDLRDASKTGGALGNVSNQEGKQLTASFSAIDRRQDAADVRSALDQAIGDVQGARTRVREAYDMTYSYKGGEAPVPRSPSAAPVAAPAANIDALLNKYK